MTRLLIENGAALDFKDQQDRTSLIWAAKSGHEAVTKLLIEKGAALNIKDIFGKTALTYAKEGRHHGVAKLLRSKLNNIFP